jgi:hypothetical protein
MFFDYISALFVIKYAQLIQACRFMIVYCNNGYILYFMIIINIVLTFRFRPLVYPTIVTRTK